MLCYYRIIYWSLQFVGGRRSRCYRTYYTCIYMMYKYILTAPRPSILLYVSTEITPGKKREGEKIPHYMLRIPFSDRYNMPAIRINQTCANLFIISRLPRFTELPEGGVSAGLIFLRQNCGKITTRTNLIFVPVQNSKRHGL